MKAKKEDISKIVAALAGNPAFIENISYGKDVSTGVRCEHIAKCLGMIHEHLEARSGITDKGELL